MERKIRRLVRSALNAFRREPLAAVSLLVSLFVGIVGSPLVFDWYSRPEVIAEIDTLESTLSRGGCGDWKIAVRNVGKKAAKNVLITYDVDYFTARGDIDGVYSGDEPLFKILRVVDYRIELGQIRIPSLAPGLQQEFVYLEIVEDA